jgi:hypothetical protein
MKRYKLVGNSELRGKNDVYSKTYNGKTLGNLISRRARKYYILGKGKVHEIYLESSTFYLGFVN